VKLLLNIPGKVWLLISYGFLACMLFWSANQPPGKLSGGVFFASLLLSWVPAYVYANRDDIRRNKVFWISQTLALLAGVLVFAVLHWNFQTDHDARAAEAAHDGTFWSIAGAAAGYWSASRALTARASRVSQWVENFLEKRLGK
jgi:hypothetical protein